MIRYDLPMKTDVPSLKPPIAKPYAGKRPHVFFLHGVKCGRETAELAERMDITWATTAYDRAWDLNKWGFGDFYDVRAAIWDFGIVAENLETRMTGDAWFDCMVVNCANGFAHFTEKTRKAILERVQKGAGLILIQPFDGKDQLKSEELDALSPLSAQYQEGFTKGGYADILFDAMITGQSWQAREHPITHGIPFPLLPYDLLACYPYEARGEVIVRTEDGHPVAAVRQVGKGRVAAFGYYPRTFLPQHKDFTGNDACFNPIMDDWHGAEHGKDFDFMEYFYRLMARAILWCADAEPSPAIADLDIAEGRVRCTAGRGELYAQIKNQWDDVVFPRQSVRAGQDLSACLRGGGVFRCDAQLLENGAIADFCTAHAAFPQPMRLVTLRCDAETLRNGDTLCCRGQVADGKGEALLALCDGMGRVLAEQAVALDGEPFEVRFPLRDILGIHVFVTLTVTDGDLPTLRGTSNRVVVTPDKRHLDDFEVWMNPQNRGMGDLLPYVNRLFPQIGMTGNLVGGNKLVAMSGGEGLGVYWYKRAGYVANKEKFLRTRDKQYLVRTPCLNDPHFWAENDKNIAHNVTRNRKYGPVAYFAQDEGSLTCYTDELEFCYCPHCLSRMREWLREVYPSLEALNQSWNTAFETWDEVTPYTTREARQSRDYASWGDHRRFMELSYANSYKEFSRMIRKHDPQGRVRMSGCQASTAFSGNDYDLLHEHVRYFEAYPVGNQYEFHRSFKSGETILGGWFGYGSQGKHVQNRIWYALFHGLTLISIFWEYACLNYDYTFSNSALAMGKAFREIRREGIGKLLLYACKQDTLGIAVHYSMASVHGTQILSRQDAFVQNRQGWLDILEDMGYQYRFVSSRQIEAGTLDTCRVLILPYSIAVGEKEAAQIRSFAQKGGLVIGDVQTGLMDEHCKLSAHGVLDDFFGIERLTTEWEHFYLNNGFERNPDFPYAPQSLRYSAGQEEEHFGTTLAEAGTRAADGVSAFVDGFMQKVPAVTVKEHGPGKGIYLNFALKDYPRHSAGPQGAALRALLHDLLGLNGLQKPATLQTRGGEPMEQGVESYYYAYGTDAHIVAVQWALNESAETNYDGLTKAVAGEAEAEARAFDLLLSKEHHVYDVRERAYLGFLRRVPGRAVPGDHSIFALLPYRAERMTLTAQGNVVTAQLHVEGPLSAPCVFAITVTDPQGVYSTLYSQNLLAQDGALVYAIPFALNDCAGDWTVEAKDVATGVSARLSIAYEGGKQHAGCAPQADR